MLIASSSQMPARDGQPQRQPGDRDAGEHGEGGLRLVSGSPRVRQPSARAEELGLASAAEALPQ